MCDCVEIVDKLLRDKGVRLSMSFVINHENHNIESEGPLLSVEWINGKKPRGKKLPSISSAYCPFCGKEKVKK